MYPRAVIHFRSWLLAASDTPSSASIAPGSVSCWLLIASHSASMIGAGLRAVRVIANAMIRPRPSRRSLVGPP